MGSLFHDYGDAETKMHSPHRELVVKTIVDGKEGKNGLLDPGIFKGTNSLHAIMDNTGLWYCRYERGTVPEPLKQRFTSLSKLLAFTKEYLGKRNVEIIEIKDKFDD